MKIFTKSLKINATVIVLVCLVIATVVFGIIFWNSNDPRNMALFGSLFAGIIVAIIQFIIAWQDYTQTEKLKELELIKVLYDRDDRTFYEDYIRKAKREIKMMGVTANRFFNDFADDSPNATSNAKVLLDALRRNVRVSILLPESEFVEENKKQDVENVKKHVKSILDKYPNYSLEVKHFNHVPTHSIFNVDDKCIVGPVFPALESKYTPALYLRNSSPLADKYLSYFDEEWNKN